LLIVTQLHKSDEPVLTVADIHKKRDVVERVCRPIASKPAPKKEAPAPAPAAAAAAGNGPATDSTADAAAGDTAAAAEAAPMEADGPTVEEPAEMEQ